jgi:UDP-3-O-[3-hydroxymyristoyl] glucosamine N-acyltransferase
MSKAGVVICKEVFETDKTLIIVSNPRLAFIRAMKAHFNNQRGLITIGTNVIIEPGTVVGCNGFSFERNENGELERFPHIGGVKIGDNVQIGSNCTIERGTFGDTVIGEGSQIDNLILVGHNSVIGKHVVVVGVTIICGSVTIGDYAYIGAGVTLRDGITIGKKAFVGMGSVVTKNVPDNVTVYGVPARVI